MSTDSILSTRGRLWFEALSGQSGKSSDARDPNSVLIADAPLGDAQAPISLATADQSKLLSM